MFSQERLEEIKWELDQFIEHPNALRSGTLLNDSHYEIIKLEEITDRTFVYKALSIETGDFVSIKEFFPKEALGFEDHLYFERDLDAGNLLIKNSSPEKEARFKTLLNGFVDEAKYLEKIAYGDPILRILDAFEDLNTAFIVTNYNRWPSLEDLMSQGYNFDGRELDFVMGHVLDVVVRFHRRGIVHRNVNPRNIYIKPDDVVIDSLGTNDFLQDIKMYNADAYHNKYYAPEIMMHGQPAGICSDVYAIGKVMIDIVCKMTPSGDYFQGLNTMSEDRRTVYADVIKSAITFNPDERLQSAMDLKEALYPKKDEVRSYRTPKGMIAMIAMISIISCMLVVWQYGGDAIMADDRFIEEPETPLGAPEGFVMVKVLDGENVYSKEGTQSVSWHKNDQVAMKSITVLGRDEDYDKTLALTEDATHFDLQTFRLASGHYHLILKYLYEGKTEMVQTSFEIKE